MKRRLISRAIFLLVGLTACTTVPLRGWVWPIQPLPESTSLRLNEEERAVYASFRRPYMRLGFVLNTVYYTSTPWLFIGGPFALRKHLRRKRGLCVACGYDLRGNPTHGCPECGWRREAEEG